MKSITYTATEYVRAWYQTEIRVTADDVRAYLQKGMEETRALRKAKPEDAEWCDDLLTEQQTILDTFEDDPYHDIWEEVASEKYSEKRPFISKPIQEDSESIEHEITDTEGWDE